MYWSQVLCDAFFVVWWVWIPRVWQNVNVIAMSGSQLCGLFHYYFVTVPLFPCCYYLFPTWFDSLIYFWNVAFLIALKVFMNMQMFMSLVRPIVVVSGLHVLYQ